MSQHNFSVGDYVRVEPGTDHPGGDFVVTGFCDGGVPTLESCTFPEGAAFHEMLDQVSEDDLPPAA